MGGNVFPVGIYWLEVGIGSPTKYYGVAIDSGYVFTVHFALRRLVAVRKSEIHLPDPFSLLRCYFSTQEGAKFFFSVHPETFVG